MSSAYRSIEYHDKDRKVEVVYNNGFGYIYYDVTPETWRKFQDAPSKGEFLHDVIRGSHRSAKR